MTERTASRKKQADNENVIIKKYANRRLYNTDTSTYITLEDLCEMVKKGTEFTVQDAKSGEDITRQILTQIIYEQEAKGENLLPVKFLREVIGYYGGQMQDFLPHYLEASMEAFTSNKEKMQEYARKNLGGLPGFSQLEEMGKQNMAFFRKTMQMFTPFDFAKKDEDETGKKK